MTTFLFALGSALIVGGVGAIYAPAAPILAGCVMVALAIGHARAEKARTDDAA